MGRSTPRTFDCSPSCKQDARISQAELGRRVGLSAPAVAERLSRLERDGTITGYRADVDPRALGFTLAAIIRMRPAPRQIPKVAEVAQATPEVVECHRVTGEDCFYMKVCTCARSSTSRRSSTASRPTARRRRRSSSHHRSSARGLEP